MPYCPECKAEFIEGSTICEDCNTELIPFLTEEQHFSSEDFRCVYTTNNMIEADMVIANLAGAGIDASVINQTDRSYPSINTGTVQIFVRAEVETDAIEFIKNLEQSENLTSPDEEETT